MSRQSGEMDLMNGVLGTVSSKRLGVSAYGVGRSVVLHQAHIVNCCAVRNQ